MADNHPPRLIPLRAGFNLAEDEKKEELFHPDSSADEAVSIEVVQTDGALHQREDIISQVLSRITSRSTTTDLGPPPDGGLHAWTIVACCHLIIMITWGVITSFGVFQTYYTNELSLPPSSISWIGSLQIFLTFFVGTLSGRLTDAGHFPLVFFFGSVFLLAGTFITSVSTSYWQLLLSQGLLVGLGDGCLFCPTLAVMSTYFSKNRGIAFGVLACGSATGGMIFPAMVRELLPRIGFAWTMRAIGLVQLISLVASRIFMRTRVPPRKNGRWVEWAAFGELEYTFYAIACFFCFWGIYFAFYYLASFGRDVLFPTLPYSSSLNLILIVNGIGLIGRTLPNYIADRIGPFNVFFPAILVSGILVLCWIAVKSATGLYVWSAVYGIFAASVQSLFPAALSSLTNDLRKQGVRMGMICTIVSFAVLTGPPVQGAVITAMHGSYLGAQICAGSSLLVGSGFMMAAKVTKSRRRGKWFKDRV